MTSERIIQAHLDRERARRETAATGKADKATPDQKLVRAAETGRFEAIVAAAQPAEPPKMVTPEEREAELRATGQSPSSTSPVQAPSEARAGRPGGGKPQARPEAFPHLDPPPSDGGGSSEPDAPPAPEPGMPTEPTAGMKWAEENIRWRPRGSGGRRPTHNPYRCLTEYDVLTGEIIGDGYDHSFEEDDQW